MAIIMGNKSRLNIFQRGGIQHILTCLVYLACLGGVALIVDAFEKRRFASIAEQATTQNIIPASALERFTSFINNADSSVIFMVFLLTVIGSGIGYFLIKRSTKLNLAWPVTLPQVVEFSSALRKIGIIEPDEQIEFVRKHSYLCSSPVRSLQGHRETPFAKLSGEAICPVGHFVTHGARFKKRQ